MLRAAFKAVACFTASVLLVPLPSFPKQTLSRQSAVPNPDGARSLSSMETPTPDPRIDPLVESLVVGRWEIDSRDLGQKEDPQYRYRWVFHFSPDHTVEMRIWLRDGYGGAEGDPPVYFGLEQAGDWFIKQGKIGIISRQCHALTAPAQGECEIESDEIGDTSYQILRRLEDGLYLTSEESEVVRFAYKERNRDMSAPDFWPAGISLRASKANDRNRPKRTLRNEGDGRGRNSAKQGTGVNGSGS